MNKYFPLICCLIFTFSGLNAQDYLEITDDDSTETNEERHQLIIEFMSTIDFDTCADIGSGNLELILKIANSFPDKVFVLEDIDSTSCNRVNMHRQIGRYDLNHIDTNLLSIHIGDTLSSRLRGNQFDLVLLSGLIHEINDKDAFFAHIKRILKPKGKILISDAFYEFPPRPHSGCTNRFLTNTEMEDLIVNQNLYVLKDWRRIGVKTSSNGTYISRIILCYFK